MSEPVAPLEITPTLLLRAYVAGVFPMAESAGSTEIFWVDPKLRGVLPLDRFHMPRSLRKRIRRGGFEVTTDTCFERVVRGCAAREETWINEEIRELYVTLHRMGFGHSVEVWMDGELAGGLYGVAIRSAFFGESMFSHRSDASKIALVWLMARLKATGYRLLDTQFVTDHLRHFGAVEVRREKYRKMLDAAMVDQPDFSAFSSSASADLVLQLSTQTS